MLTLYRDQEYNFQWLVIDTDRVLAEPTEIKWRIYSDTSSLVQVEPVAGWNTLDLVAQEVSTGVYNIPWTVPVDALVGQWWLEVSVTIDSVTTVSIQEFEVMTGRVIELSDSTNGGHLAPLWELRTLYTTTSDKAIYGALLSASRTIEQWTHYVFSPRHVSQKIPCTYNGKLDLPQPVCVLSEVTDSNDDAIEIDCEFRRHLESPNVGIDIDDRLTPLLALDVYKGREYTLKAWTGYTDYDNTPLGKTPDMIRNAALRLSTIILDGLIDPGDSSGRTIISEKTATQTVDYQDTPSGLAGVLSSTIITADTVLYQMLKPFYRADKISLV